MVGQPARRYQALDALRGICALLVALFHLKSAGYISALPLIRNAWLFVDFFFVLSGFVIAASYGDKLREGFGIGRFMALRLGRVYPLHLFVLGIYVAFETFKLLIGNTALSFNPAWQSPNGPLELIQSLTLTHIFGFSDSLSWNGPSWSIAAEVWTYFIMAAVLVVAGKRAGYVVAAIGLGCGLTLLALGHPFLDRTHNFALVRCLYGFSLGMIAFTLCRSRGPWAQGGGATVIEWVTIGLVVAFAALIPAQGWPGLLAPPVFMIAVMVFAFEQGGASRLLTRPFPLLLGAASYSIYMIHVFVEARMIDVALVVSNMTGLPLASMGGDAIGQPGKVLGTAELRWMGDAMTLVTLVLIVCLSLFTYRLVEQPCRALVRQRVLGSEPRVVADPVQPVA